MPRASEPLSVLAICIIIAGERHALMVAHALSFHPLALALCTGLQFVSCAESANRHTARLMKDNVKATPESKSMQEETPFACNMLALTPEGKSGT
ncbi:MAG: hypothetical protein WKF84_00785 [Pyrinomonadaceae bacterium]